jgi:hypothetical protein
MKKENIAKKMSNTDRSRTSDERFLRELSHSENSYTEISIVYLSHEEYEGKEK